MARLKKIKCLHCKQYFLPDPRNVGRQKFCSAPACRKASKAASQKKWLSKPENQNYFRSPDNIRRVQAWRRNNPGYWRRHGKEQDALQEPLIEKVTEKPEDTAHKENIALQDILIAQPAVLLGLIAQFSGVALQDDIAVIVQNMQQLGQDILNTPNYSKGGNSYEHQKRAPMSPSGT